MFIGNCNVFHLWEVLLSQINMHNWSYLKFQDEMLFSPKIVYLYMCITSIYNTEFSRWINIWDKGTPNLTKAIY